MKQNEHQHLVDHHQSDGATDAVAAAVIVLCIAAMFLFWVSGQ